MSVALLLVACVCSSCGVYWNIGDNIMQAPVTYTGVDINHPVGGVVYRKGKGENATYYMQAPEYTYKKRRNVVEMVCLGNLKEAYPYRRHIYGGKPIGKNRWVQVAMSEVSKEDLNEEDLVSGKERIWFWVKEECAGPPKGARALPAGNWKHVRCFDFTDLEERRNILYAPACAVGAPIRYVVDPVLTAVSTVAWYAMSIAITPVQLPAIYLWHHRQEQKENQDAICKCQLQEA